MSNEVKLILILINLAVVDNNLDDREVSWIKKLIAKYIKSAEDEELLLSEIKSPKHNYLKVFKSIENVFMREQVISFAGYLFKVDEEISESEKEAFQNLKDAHQELSKGMNQIEKENSYHLDMGKGFLSDLKKLSRNINNKKVFARVRFHFIKGLFWLVILASILSLIWFVRESLV